MTSDEKASIIVQSPVASRQSPVASRQSMPHIFESAPTARSQCRACGRKIERGELRFGERRDNAFGGGEATLWFHLLCAAYARPEPLLELLASESVADAAVLRAIAEVSVAHPQLARLRSAERAPTGRANCRHCHKAIQKDSWRLALVYFEEFRFSAAGYIHASCAQQYFGTADLAERLWHFSPDFPQADLNEVLHEAGRSS